MSVNNTYYADGWPLIAPAAIPPSVAITMNFRFTMANSTVLAASSFSANDIVKLAPLSQGIGICLDEYFVDIPQLDTGTSIVLALGDDGGASSGTTNAAIFQSAANVARASADSFLTPFAAYNGATAVTGPVSNAIPKVYTAAPWKQVYVTDTGSGVPAGSGGYSGNAPISLILKVTTAANTGVTNAVIKGWIRFHAYGPYPLV